MTHIDKAYLMSCLMDLLVIDSPTGRTMEAIDFCEQAAERLHFQSRRTQKGGLLILTGKEAAVRRILSAHVDTLGAMVAEVKPSGRLRLTPIGGMKAPSLEGARVDVETLTAQRISGTVLPSKASTHVFGPGYETQERTFASLEVRLDMPVFSAEDTRAAGIEVGDFVLIDPLPKATAAGFIVSRFLDDKAAVAALLAALKALDSPSVERDAAVYISPYEEVGHGCPAGIPDSAEEIVAVDMAAVGPSQHSSEFHVTVCAKDSGGPYDLALTRQLVNLARSAGLEVRIDTYPYYASDATAAARSGRDARIALFGPGVDASHTHERTHLDAVVATAELARAYIEAPRML